MRTLTISELEQDVSAVLAAAEREAVPLTRNGRPAVVMVPAAEYERLLGQARTDLRAIMERTQAGAAARGLTDEKLAELLADESCERCRRH